jgi:glutathione synthase/RimK-type ligase-like ATP-grasp enzyme
VLLIITNQQDLASDYLILRLKERGVVFRRLNTEQVGFSVSIELKLSNGDNNFKIEFEDGTVITRESISAVYFRQPQPPDYSTLVVKHEVAFANTEVLELLRSLWRMIPEHLWLNHPKKLWAASNKVEQLITAVRHGLKVPQTLISANAISITEFFSKNNNHVVGKAIRHGFVTRENDLYLAGTQRMPYDFSTVFNDFAPVPMTYQEEIHRKCDLRVVVVDNHVFSTSITFDNSLEQVDWRISELLGRPLIHSRSNLPKGIELSCTSLVRAFGLRYSSIDLIQDTSDNVFFLELNPNGQWGWIEQLTGHPIRDAIINALT